MLITERKFGIFKFVNVFFAEEPVTVNIPDCDVVIYHTYKNWGDVEGFDRIQYPTTTIDLSQDINEIWNKIKRQHKRHIRRAEKNDIIVKVSNNYEEFHRFFKRFLKQKNYAEPFGLNIPSSKFMQKYGILFIAENRGEILGGNLYFHDENNALLVNGAYQIFEKTIDKYKWSADASCYLQWEAMQYFKNLDVINYDLGGLNAGEINIHHKMPGLNYSKLSFGGKVISQYEYRKFNSRFNQFLFHSWNFLRSCI
jgi:lipid II:glycine glycyltransferase (peptidoglycan interpeptide bridge formation enzyme)